MRERTPALAQERFREQAEALRDLPLDRLFERIHSSNLWGSNTSRSGLGSELDATARLREALPELLAVLGAEVLLDVPCGDFGWLSRVALPVRRYVGAEIVEAIVEANRAAYPDHEFLRLDLCADRLPPADVVLCRDCLVHLSLAHVFRAVENIRGSGARWLLTTTFPLCETNLDIQDGDWRMLNFELPPFGWPPPAGLINEGCAEAGGAYADKSLGLWCVADLPDAIS